MKLPLFLLGLAAALSTGCGSSGGGSVAPGTGANGGGGNGGSGATASGGAAGAGASGGSAGATSSGGSGAGGPVTMSCDAPSLIVVRDVEGSGGKAESIARLALSLSGPVTGLQITGVEQVDLQAQTLRSWAGADFTGPPGFDGSVQADDTNQYRVALWASAPALQAETDACDLKPWERSGTLKVSAVTNEGGPIQFDCGLGLGLGGRGPESLRWTCAKGLPGWLDGMTGIENVAAPVTAALADSTIHVLNSSANAYSGFAADGATLAAYFADGFSKPCTAPPESWDFPPGTHDLWRGQSSNDAWSGPVAPGENDWAYWMWQLVGAQFPQGVCFVPDPNPPTDPTQICEEPVLGLTLSGNSSAGSWEWESDLFQCYDLSGM
jgi:hypothetical protein